MADKKGAELVEARVLQIRPYLAGLSPHVQSAILADLLASFIAGWAPSVRAAVLTDHLNLVRDLIPHENFRLFGNAGHPDR